MPDEKPTEEKLMTLADMKDLAHSYHVPMSEGTLKSLAENMTPEKAKAFEDHIKMTAQGLYPTLAPQIKAGIPTATLLDPYRQLGKQMLGEQFEPDFQSDPKAMRALTGNVDPATGRPAPMSLDQWRSHLMSEPAFEWGKTPAAHEMANTLMDTLSKGFAAGPNAATEQKGGM